MQMNGYEVRNNYTQEEIDEIISRSPYYKATSDDIDWIQKVRMRGRVQKMESNHSISVTINLPSDVTEELVGNLYVEAWRCGCKGCTVYRDGSRSGVLIAVQKEAKKEKEKASASVAVSPADLVRPTELEADVVRFQNNREKWIAFIGLKDGKPYEIFTGLADDEDGILIPKNITKGKIIKAYGERDLVAYSISGSRTGADLMKPRSKAFPSKDSIPEVLEFLQLIPGICVTAECQWGKCWRIKFNYS